MTMNTFSHAGQNVTNVFSVGVKITKSRLTPVVIALAIALYACHIAGVASMPGQNQTFFLYVIYLTQLYLFLSVTLGYCAGLFKARAKLVIAFVAISSVATLIALGFAGTASMEGPNQLQFLGTFFVLDAVLVIASLGAYAVGTRHKKPSQETEVHADK